MASHTRLRSSVARILDVLYGNQSTKANDFTGSITGMCYMISYVINVNNVILTIVLFISIFILSPSASSSSSSPSHLIIIVSILSCFPSAPEGVSGLILGSVFACHLFKRGD